MICNGQPNRPIKLAVYDWNSNGNHVLIGEVVTSLSALQPHKDYLLKHPEIAAKKGAKYKGSGLLRLTSYRLEKRHTFLDFIRGGLQLNLIVAIDFTASNGAPSTKESLHYIHPNSALAGSQRNFSAMNEYQKAILSIGEILQDYDSDNKYPVYGFGGSINGATSHAFPLTFDPTTPEVHGVQGILEAYANSFGFVSLSGPTLFSEILQLTHRYTQANDCSQRNQQYTILLIITDGVINDMDATIKHIVDLSTEPLSIIIVGVGDADFGNMEVLDADDKPLVSRGKQMARDIVQFVPFRDFQNSHYSALAAEVLAEIPEQVTSYMRARQINPNAITEQPSVGQINIMRSQRHLSGLGSGGAEVPTATPVAAPVAASAPPPTMAADPRLTSIHL